MTYITSIGLDVHARSVSACAFDPFTGEVTQRRFGTDAGEIAEWIPGFESPKAVYESGPTGFALCRELRALGVDCVVGAVSKMHDTVNVFFTNRANGSAPSAQTHFHQSRKRSFAASG